MSGISGMLNKIVNEIVTDPEMFRNNRGESAKTVRM